MLAKGKLFVVGASRSSTLCFMMGHREDLQHIYLSMISPVPLSVTNFIILTERMILINEVENMWIGCGHDLI
jgi:hypothetical protein